MRAFAVAVSISTLVLGCGAGEQTRAARDDDESHLVEVNPTINICPHFEGSFILPQTISPGTTAFIAVRAVDPDADSSELTFKWTATSGEFSDPDRPLTEYDCDALGDQLLKLVARDAGQCDSTLNMTVTCLSE